MPSLTETRHPATPTPPRRRTRRKSALARAAASRRLDESPGTTHASGSGASSSADGDAPSAAAAGAAAEVSVPAGECEACPRDWRVANERDDERIPGEYASCEKHGRRRQFEHAVLFQETNSSETIARNVLEYRPCRYTEADEIFRMVRMQVICLVIAMWCMRNVLKQKIVSASLFDQRRMKLTSAKGSGGAVANIAHKTALVKRKTSMDVLETVELLPATTGRAPLSLGADPDLPTV